MKVEFRSVGSILFFSASMLIAYFWIQLLFNAESMIDPENLPQGKFVRYGSILFGYMSALLIATTIVPASIAFVLAFKSNIKPLKGASSIYIGLALVLALVQCILVLFAGQPYA